MTTHRIALVGLLAWAGHWPRSPRPGFPWNAVDGSVLQRMLDAEDARASDSSALAPVLTGLRSPDIATRRTAVRAIGRIERLENLPAIQPMVTDVSAGAGRSDQRYRPDRQGGGRKPDGDRRRAAPCTHGNPGATPRADDQRVRPDRPRRLARTLGRLPYRPKTSQARAPPNRSPRCWMASQAMARSRASRGSGSLTATDALLRRFPNLRTAPGVLRVAQIPRVPSVASRGDARVTRVGRERRTSSSRQFAAGCSALPWARPMAVDEATARAFARDSSATSAMPTRRCGVRSSPSPLSPARSTIPLVHAS